MNQKEYRIEFSFPDRAWDFRLLVGDPNGAPWTKATALAYQQATHWAPGVVVKVEERTVKEVPLAHGGTRLTTTDWKTIRERRVERAAINMLTSANAAPKHVLDAVAEELARRTAEGPLYHVTYYNRLGSIAEDGLVPNRSRAIGAPSYDAHAAGRVFLTEQKGVPFWVNRAEAFAEHSSDDVHGDGLAPVVLRVAEDCFENAWMMQDPEGTRDALADAWMTIEDFPPECLEVFAGEDWRRLDEGGADAIDPDLAFEAQDVPEDEKDEDGEPEHYYQFRDRSPLNPFRYR